MRRPLSISIALAIVAVAASAEATDRLTAFMAISEGPPTVSQLSIARSYLRRECQSLLQLVPALSPIQEQWLEEQIAGDSLDAVTVSPELNRRALRRALSQCIKGAELAGRTSEPEIAILGWSLIAAALADPDTEIYAQRARVSALEPEGHRLSGLLLFVDAILDNIIVPHLAGQAGGVIE